jgi:MFS family permease
MTNILATKTLVSSVLVLYLSLTAHAFSATHRHHLPSLKNGHGFTSMNPISTNTFNKQQEQHNGNIRSSSNTAMDMSLGIRGGSSAILSSLTSNPTDLFNTNLVCLALTTALIRIVSRVTSKDDNESDSASKTVKPQSVKALQIRFLAVFWLLRCADWLQGPYFYEVYSSKIFNGVPASLAVVSKLFLTGFASTAFFGPFVGRLSDSKGRKRGTLAFALLYSLGAMSTKSSVLGVLLMGRVMSGIGTSLLFSAPEAWLVGEATKDKDGEGGKYLGETFGLAYAGDAIVAILAGQFAGVAAGKRGPTGPFELSVGFLAAGALLASFLWKENKAESTESSDGEPSKEPTIKDALDVVTADPKIMLVGAVQSLFEAAMYIFVLQWPPAIAGAVSKAFGGSATPYGTVFSCFMASCLLGSTIFGQLVKKNVPTETFTSVMLTVATLSMGTAAWLSTASSTAIGMPFAAIIAAFFAFEGCVGMYFPSIGTLRSKYVPDSHRGVIMNLFGIPLNVLVVSVFLSIKRLGVGGALSVSTGALGLATLSMLKLKSITSAEKGNVAMA